MQPPRVVLRCLAPDTFCSCAVLVAAMLPERKSPDLRDRAAGRRRLRSGCGRVVGGGAVRGGEAAAGIVVSDQPDEQLVKGLPALGVERREELVFELLALQS